MFTGIVEGLGRILSIEKEKGNITFTLESSFANELKEGQSVAHNGVCLTVEIISGKNYSVTGVKETLSKTNLGKLKVRDEINLERSLKIGDRLDGHFVQGHVDCTAELKTIKKEKGSWIFTFQVPSSRFQVPNLIIQKGSVCVNGVSLTVVDSKPQTPNSELVFSVAIIPHTFKHTNFSSLKKGSEVNIEFDMLGKHIQKIISNK